MSFFDNHTLLQTSSKSPVNESDNPNEVQVHIWAKDDEGLWYPDKDEVWTTPFELDCIIEKIGEYLVEEKFEFEVVKRDCNSMTIEAYDIQFVVYDS